MNQPKFNVGSNEEYTRKVAIALVRYPWCVSVPFGSSPNPVEWQESHPGQDFARYPFRPAGVILWMFKTQEELAEFVLTNNRLVR